MDVLRIVYIQDNWKPVRVEEELHSLRPDVVVGPEWARAMSVGSVFIPIGKTAEKLVGMLKREHIRMGLGDAQIDEMVV